jgi:hypothetical protein
MRDESNLVNMTFVEEDAAALYEAGYYISAVLKPIVLKTFPFNILQVRR